MLASSLGMQSKTSDVFQFLEKAYQLDLEQLEYAFQYGLALEELDHIGEAIEVFEDILKKDAMHADARYNLAVALLFQEQTDQAIVELDKILELDPDFEPATDLLMHIEFLKEEMDE